MCAFDKVGIPQPDLIAGIQAVVLGWRRLPKVILLDVKYLREGDFTLAGAWIFWVVDSFHLLDEILGIVIQDQLEGLGDSHPPKRMFIEIISDALLQKGYVCDHTGIGCGNRGPAHTLHKVNN